jgi:GDSL-like Lipase/Acylhydrolase
MKIKHFFVFLIIVAQACSPDLPIPQAKSGDADFTKSIAIGGSFMAGYQDGALFMKGQKNCIPALITQQLELAGAPIFNQHLLSDDNGLGMNSKPWESWFLSSSKLGYKTDCKGITSLSPIKTLYSLSFASPYLQGISGNGIQNLSIPFANISDYFNPNLGNSVNNGNRNPYYNIIASNPGTSLLINDAKAQNPSFVMAWLGMDDIFNYAASGGTAGTILSPSSFESKLDQVLATVTQNGAKGILATIPDFRVFPYYTLIPYDNAVLTTTQADSLNDLYSSTVFSQIHFHEGRNGFIIDDNTLPEGARQLKASEYITLSVPIDSMKCYKYGLVINAINNRYALDSTEIFQIDFATSQYNQIIKNKAAQYGFALADMFDFFNKVKTGIKWDGVDYNTTFVSGGFISLDGYHPTQKGYGIIANQFIEAINQKYNSSIPPNPCANCDGVIFP